MNKSGYTSQTDGEIGFIIDGHHMNHMSLQVSTYYSLLTLATVIPVLIFIFDVPVRAQNCGKQQKLS